ncbi:hypothetical protein ACHAQJ_004504 [Trichoderma viride]
MSSIIYHGSCLCGDIVFDIEGEPEKVFSCYCLDCAKNAGGPYQLVAKYDSNKIKVNDPKNVQAVWVIHKTQSGLENWQPQAELFADCKPSWIGGMSNGK